MVIRFKWVDCQMTALKKCRTIEDIEIALRELPEDLDATYDRILNNIRDANDRKRAKAILQLIAVACRPLTIEEVSETLTVDCESQTINVKRKMRNPLEIIEICSSNLEPSEPGLCKMSYIVSNLTVL